MDLIGLIYLILGLALCGFIVYLIITYIPMPAPFPQIIMVVIAIVMILYVLQLLSNGSLGNLHLRN